MFVELQTCFFSLSGTWSRIFKINFQQVFSHWDTLTYFIKVALFLYVVNLWAPYLKLKNNKLHSKFVTGTWKYQPMIFKKRNSKIAIVLFDKWLLMHLVTHPNQFYKSYFQLSLLLSFYNEKHFAKIYTWTSINNWKIDRVVNVSRKLGFSDAVKSFSNVSKGKSSWDCAQVNLIVWFFLAWINLF